MVTHFLIKKKKKRCVYIVMLLKHRYKSGKSSVPNSKEGSLTPKEGEIRDGFSFMCFVVFFRDETSMNKCTSVHSLGHQYLPFCVPGWMSR